MKAIYKITNSVNGRLYIGSTVNYLRRRQTHKSQLRKNKHHSPLLQRSWNKYGEDKFIFEIIEEVDVSNDLLKREQYWIDKISPVLNCLKIVGSPLGRKTSDETKNKISIGIKKYFVENGSPLKGFKPTYKTKKKISLGLKKYFAENESPLIGFKHTLEAKHNMSVSRLSLTKKERNHKSDCACFICKPKSGKDHCNYIEREERFCVCNCGNSFICLINSKKRFINGHNMRKVATN